MLDDSFLVSGGKSPELVRLAYEFNFFPLNYIHQSWFSVILNGELLDRLNAKFPNNEKLSSHILDILKISDKFVWDFGTDVLKLALLEPLLLWRLQLYMGLVLYSPVLRKIISGDLRRTLMEEIGVEGFEFAIKKAPFFYRDELIASLLVEGEFDEAALSQISQVLVKMGSLILMSCYSGTPVSFYKRLVLKLPHNSVPTKDDFKRYPELLNSQEGVERLAVRVMDEIKPSWRNNLV
jgi:YOP proteins translocation protein K (YscK)